MLVGYLFDDIIDNLDNYRNGVEKINTHSKHDNDIVFLVLCVFSVNTRPELLKTSCKIIMEYLSEIYIFSLLFQIRICLNYFPKPT